LKATLAQVACPVSLVQGSDDPVVVADSVNRIVEYLGEVSVEVKMIDSQRHGIINEDIGDTWATIIASLEAWTDPGGVPGSRPES